MKNKYVFDSSYLKFPVKSYNIFCMAEFFKTNISRQFLTTE